ncbi:MAG: efflux RND transporter periplasmic adaptor subunit [Planctomycetota bacterium]
MTIAIQQSRLLLACMLVALCVTGCQQATRKPAARTKQVEKPVAKIAVGTVRRQELRQTVTLPATIESDETAMIMARVEAYIDQVLVDIGDEVRSGQPLIRLKAPELQQAADAAQAMIEQVAANEQVLMAELAAAEKQLDVVRAELTLKQSKRDRRERLVSAGAVAETLLEEAEAAVQSTAAVLAKYENATLVVKAKLAQGKSELKMGRAKLAQAQTLVDYLEIEAPFAGVIAERNVDPGNLVRPTSQSSMTKPLVVLAKVDKLRALVHATTDVASQLAVGQTVEFAADDVPGKTFTGTLSRTSGTYNRKTRMMQAEVDLQNDPDTGTGQRPLRAGSYGSATIVLRSEELPVIPMSALRDRGSHQSVFVVSDGECIATSVQVAYESDGKVAIASGLTAGDRVVVDADSVRDEQKLKDSETETVSW